MRFKCNKFNIIAFTTLIDKLSFSSYGKRMPNAASIKWKKLVESIPKVWEVKFKSYYCN